MVVVGVTTTQGTVLKVRSLRKAENCWSRGSCGLHGCMPLSKLFKLYTSEFHVVLYVNYTTIKCKITLQSSMHTVDKLPWKKG